MTMYTRRMESSPHAFDRPAHALRSAARSNLYFAAQLIGLGSRQPVTVRNLSATGALVRAQGSLQDLGPICLMRGDLRARGTLAWHDGRNGGISFFQPIDLDEWAPGVAGVALDAAQTVERSEGEPAMRPRERDGLPDRRSFLGACIAEELAFASRRIEALGSELADDPVIAIRHAGRLQDIAITVQVLGDLARLLSSDAPEEELAAIGQPDLRRRLERSAPL